MARQIGRNIAALRNARGWSQVMLAARVGVTRSRLSKWEGGEHVPSLERLVDLAGALGAGLEDLVTSKSSRSSEDLTVAQRQLVLAAMRSLYRLVPPGEKPADTGQRNE